MPIVRIGQNSADDFSGLEDTFIPADDPTGNRNDAADITVGKYAEGQEADAQFRANGLSSIAGPVVVTEVRLYGSIEFMAVNNGHTLSARRLLRNMNFDQATWNEYTTGNDWTAPGARGDGTDRVATISGQLVLTGSESGYVYLTGAGMAADVEAWINGDFTNLGWTIERTDGAFDETFFAFTSGVEGNADGTRPYLYVDYEEVAAGGDMACVMSFGFGVIGNLDGRGALSGTQAMSLSVTGELDGRGRLAATIPAAFSVAAAIDGGGRLTTTAPMVVSLAGDLSAAGELTTQASAAFSVTGELDGRAPMSVAMLAAFTFEGELQGAAQGFMTLSTGATFALAGELDGRGALAVTMPTGFALAGHLVGHVDMSGALALGFSVAGELTGLVPGDMTMALAAGFDLAGELDAAGRLTTLATVTFTLSGDLRAAGDLFAATLPLSFGVTGVLIDLPDIADMVGNMEVAFGWLAELLNVGQGEPIEVDAATFRAKMRAVPMHTAVYLDRYYNFAKREQDIAVVRVTFDDGTRLDLPLREYERLYATEKTDVRDAGVSVSIIDRRDGEY